MNNTLVKGLQLLECLARSDRPLGVSQIANSLGMGKSGVHRLLQALVELGYAQRDPDQGVYWATLKTWELGTAVVGRLDVRNAAEATLYRLRDATRETTHLSVLEGFHVVYILRLDSPQPVRLSSEVGRRAPAYAVSTGKAILAFAPAAQLDAISRQLVAQTPATIVDPEAFLREMERIRQQGYSISRGEWTEGVWGVGAPVRAPNGAVVAAISATAPVERLGPQVIDTVIAQVIEAAVTISANLTHGSRGASGPDRS